MACNSVYAFTPASRQVFDALKPCIPPGVECAAAEIVPGLDAQTLLAHHAARFPAEAALIQKAVPQRVFEFLAARNLARRLLACLGVPESAIGRGRLGEPVFPQGHVGSITHANGMVIVAVARSAHYASLGLDLEPDEALPPAIVSRVCLPGEQTSAPAARAVFTAKEAFYKAQYTFNRCVLDFTDVRLSWNSSHWRAELLGPQGKDALITRLDGTCVSASGWVAAFCAVPALLHSLDRWEDHEITSENRTARSTGHAFIN